MQLIFDRGTADERAIDVDYYGENLFRGTLNANWNHRLAESPDVPNLGTLRSRPTFATLELVDGAVRIPAQGTYNQIQDASAAYNAREGSYSVTVMLGYAEDQ